MSEPLAEMLRYSRWANATLFAACRALPDDQLDLTMPGGSGSVRVLLMHIAGGQQTFVLRTKGRQHEGELHRYSPWPGWDALMSALDTSSDELVAVAEATDAGAQADLPFQEKVYRFRKVFFLVHAVEHGTEHRTEIKLILGHHGIATPDLDGWQYGASAGYGVEV